MLFSGQDGYKAGMKTHGKELAADIPNLANCKPVIQGREIIG